MEINIPIIEAEPGGYWEIFPDQRTWHGEDDKEIMSFQNQKEIEKKYQIGGGWITLMEGANKLRVVSDCVDYGSHYGNGKSTICLGKEDCQLCRKGFVPTVQFLAWAIDRRDQGIKLFRFGYKIYKQIMAYKNNEEYAFDGTPGYDITINRVGVGKNSDYTVVPARQNTDLTDEESIKIGKLKDIQDVIDKMKAKVEPAEQAGAEDKQDGILDGDEQINVEDIPF